MTLYFPMIGKYLAWRVSNGAQVRIGIDALMGCGKKVFFAKNKVLTLQELRRCTSNMVNNPTETTLWSQG
jgi:hypothetical protein